MKGYSRKSIGKNIKMEKKGGRSKKQALAIALSVARRAAQKAGKPEKAPKKKKNRASMLVKIGRRLKGMRR